MAVIRPGQRCPCGSGQGAARCCLPALRGRRWPETAEALMRSRYTAFAVGDLGWLERTHDPATRGDFDAEDVRQWNAGNRWISLTILGTEAGGVGDDAGRVRFEALFRRADGEHSLREDSAFRRVDGRWVYVDGEALPG
ncbi:MAG: YchJ family metal-binding protein [bacterium]